jgi:hypothetical protein
MRSHFTRLASPFAVNHMAAKGIGLANGVLRSHYSSAAAIARAYMSPPPPLVAFPNPPDHVLGRRTPPRETRPRRVFVRSPRAGHCQRRDGERHIVEFGACECTRYTASAKPGSSSSARGLTGTWASSCTEMATIEAITRRGIASIGGRSSWRAILRFATVRSI